MYDDELTVEEEDDEDIEEDDGDDDKPIQVSRKRSPLSSRLPSSA